VSGQYKHGLKSKCAGKNVDRACDAVHQNYTSQVMAGRERELFGWLAIFFYRFFAGGDNKNVVDMEPL
jgi:hypothetical protein